MNLKVMLVPPPDLPVPAVQGGAVETLLEHLILENESQQKLDLFCVSVPDPAAIERASKLHFTKMLWLSAEPNRRKYYRYLCGLRRRLGMAAPLDPWYGKVLKQIMYYQPEIVVSEGGNPTEFCSISRHIGSRRCLLHLHGPTIGGPALDPLFGGVLSLSEYTRKEFLSTSHISASNVKLLPNCIDLKHFSPRPTEEISAFRAKLGISSTDFAVLFCGRITPEKGIHKLIRAFQLLPDKRFRLIVIGSPFFAAQSESPFFNDLKKNAASLGKKIIFTGFVSHEELPLYYGAADLACFPALWQEPAGLVAIEAMACGRPILATHSGGMTEYLEGSGAELLPIEPQDTLPRRLADSIVMLAADSARRMQMCQMGLIRSRVFGQDQYYNNFVDAIENFVRE